MPTDDDDLHIRPHNVMFDPITAPPGWNPRHDLQYAEEILGCAVDGWHQAFRRIRDWHGEVSNFLAAIFSFLCPDQQAALTLDLEVLSLVEALAVVELHCVQTERKIDRTRCLSALHQLRWADQERGRILCGVFAQADSPFMYPLLRLGDRLVTALMDLEEAVFIGVPGFSEYWREFQAMNDREV